MNINDFLLEANGFASEFLSSYCVINGGIFDLKRVENLGFEQFALLTKNSVPLKLYKYFPDKTITDDKGNKINYSISALQDNTVFLQNPLQFDDIYDSDINIEFFEYEYLRLKTYCTKCGIKTKDDDTTQELGNAFVQELYAHFIKNKSFDNLFKKKPVSEIEKLTNQKFIYSLIIELQNNSNLAEVVSKIIWNEYCEFLEELRTTFRISCFSTTPYSQLMWGGSYADCHKGFCIEYTVLPNDEIYRDIYYNLFPMIYCKTRPNVVNELYKLKDSSVTKDTLWNIYFNGALRKSIDWAFQNEWRLLLPIKSKDTSNYNVKFFPITKVFLGNRMSKERRKEIINICKEKNIPYIGVRRKNDAFEMEECNIKCEDCAKFTQIE